MGKYFKVVDFVDLSFNFRSVGLNTTFKFYERSYHANTYEENIWKSNCYIESTWTPLVPGSLNIEDWRLKKYFVHVVETGETFGEAPDACKDLC